MTENLYEAPKSDLSLNTDIPIEHELASRSSRLGASILDGIIMMIIVMATMYLMGGFEVFMRGEELSYLYEFGIGIYGLIVFVIINFQLLKENGQTIGKKLVGIKVVDIEGNKAEINNHLLKRYLVYLLPNQIPVAGSTFQFINVLFIFRQDKRCIHDLVAKTKVVRCL